MSSEIGHKKWCSFHLAYSNTTSWSLRPVGKHSHCPETTMCEETQKPPLGETIIEFSRLNKSGGRDRDWEIDRERKTVRGRDACKLAAALVLFSSRYSHNFTA